MYKTIAKRKVRGAFASLSEGDHRSALSDTAEDVHHVFPGENAVGGERHSREAMGRWLERLGRLFPELEFDVKRVAVKGPPWDMKIAVEWTDRGLCADGVAYENEGAHWIRLVRGKAKEIHAYLDTGKVTAHCERMAAAGIDEAKAEPIT